MSASKKPSSRLGTRLRGKLQKDVVARGKSRYSLWYVYSPKGRTDVVLHGDTRYYQFLLVESDPQVVSASYNFQEKAARIVGEELGRLVDTEIRMVDDSVVWRCAQAEEDASFLTKLDNLQLLIAQRIHKDLPTRVEVITSQQAIANPIRIQNWNRLLPYLAQARTWPLHVIGNDVATFLHTREEVALCEVMELAELGQEALYIAALLHGVQFGRFQSDLHDLPWSLGSRFWVMRS